MDESGNATDRSAFLSLVPRTCLARGSDGIEMTGGTERRELASAPCHGPRATASSGRPHTPHDREFDGMDDDLPHKIELLLRENQAVLLLAELRAAEVGVTHAYLQAYFAQRCRA